MQEFSSINVSSYEADSMASLLTEQSRDGWSVVAIVPTGSTITAYLSRTATGDEGSDARAADASTGDAGTGDTSAVTDEPATADSADDAPTDPTSEPAGWAAGTATAAATAHPTPQPAATAEPAAEPAAPTAPTASAAPASATAAAPAGWYADPSSRFELRYWDGNQWTEHVSRSGQQYTDPPVA